MNKKQNESAESQIAELIASNDEEFLEKYILSNSSICEKVIRRYLLRLSGSKGVTLLGTGMGEYALPPVKRPKTLEEARVIANQIIDK